jgi:hypothetical protein
MKPTDRKDSIASENKRTERMPKERPERGPEPDTLEGPGDRDEAKGEADARNKTTRRGER